MFDSLKLAPNNEDEMEDFHDYEDEEHSELDSKLDDYEDEDDDEDEEEVGGAAPPPLVEPVLGGAMHPAEPKP